VVVDEAYIEFSEQRSVVELLAEFDNLIVLRTLSKALACAGARCGSVIAAVPVARVLAAVQAPYALSTPVVECVENALEDGGFNKSRQWIGEVIQERAELVTRLAEYDFVEKIWPSDANFFLIRVADAKAVVAHCAAQGILIRNFADDLVDCIRITVGSHGENQRLLDVLRSYTGANP
jgi:histidinol-phosphate aminotransferase